MTANRCFDRPCCSRCCTITAVSASAKTHRSSSSSSSSAHERPCAGQQTDRKCVVRPHGHDHGHDHHRPYEYHEHREYHDLRLDYRANRCWCCCYCCQLVRESSRSDRPNRDYHPCHYTIQHAMQRSESDRSVSL